MTANSKRGGEAKDIVLVVDAFAETRAQLCRALRAEHWQVAEADGVRAAMSTAINRRPSVIVLDWDLDEGIGADLVALFREEPSTEGIPLIACGQGSSVETRFAALRAGAADYLPKPVDIKALRAILERIKDVPSTSEEEESDKPLGQKTVLNNSLYTRSLQCKLHHSGTSFLGFCLRSKTQLMETNLFDIPRYIRPMGKSDYCNFYLLEVRVCPDCFFASAEDRQFRVLSGRVDEVFSPAERVVNLLGRAAPHRRKTGSQAGQNLWAENRTVDEAITAYELGVMSAQALYEAASTVYAEELCRIASYHFKSAELLLNYKKDAEAHDRHLEGALEALERGYLELEMGPNLFRAIYQIVALLVWFGRDAPSRRYLSRFRDLYRGKSTALSERHRGLLNRYYQRAQTVYEDRDLIREREIP